MYLASIFESNQNYFMSNGSNGAVHNRSTARHGRKMMDARRAMKVNPDEQVYYILFVCT